MASQENYERYSVLEGNRDVDSRFLAAINAICSDINDIYLVDRETKAVSVIRQAGQAIGLGTMLSTPFTYEQALSTYTENNVFEKDRESILNEMKFSKICEGLKKTESLSMFYRVFRNDELHYFRVKCIRLGSAEDFKEIIFAFMPEDFESSQSQMVRSLERDELTNVYTKQAFYHYVSDLLDENPGKEYDIIMTDVENFKLVNSIYGRSGGDELLKYLANCYTMAAREGFCARFESDHFVIITKAMSDQEVSLFAILAERLRVSAPLPYLTFRYGIYRKVDRNDSVPEMCDKALLAIRSRKSSFDEAITYYDRAVIEEHLRAKVYEADFERAISQHEFVVWVQPKYNAFTKRMTSAEALVRWKTAEGKFISPGEFIPVFESDGLIVKLDEYVFRYVCLMQRRQLDEGKEPIPISVNLSRATLFRAESIPLYLGIVEEYDLPKELVPLELTESATVDNVQINILVEKLRAAGFVLHMDDFGSGYSSLSSLSTLPFHTLKLDKSLIDGIGQTGGNEVLRHIIEMAHFFQMEVVAEGVEQNDQYTFLKKLSCDTIQGYFFCKPVPFAEFLQIREEQPEEESTLMDSKLLADDAIMGSLRITNETKLQYLNSLASIYMTMHVVDLKEDTVTEFTTTTNVKEHVNKAHNCVAQMAAAMTATVSPDYLDACLTFTDLTTLPKRMKGKRTISAEFVGKHFGWFRASFFTVTTNENDEPEKVIYTTQVIEADKRKEEQLLACRTDELTGVFNRSAYDEDIATLDQGENGEARWKLTVIVTDVNGLKAINDTYGHAAGDELIWGVADTLNTVLGKDSRIYRMGGDRFAAFFHADSEELKEILRRYEDALQNWMGNEVRTLNVSYGVAEMRENPALTPDELVSEADHRRLAWKAAHIPGYQKTAQS